LPDYEFRSDLIVDFPRAKTGPRELGCFRGEGHNLDLPLAFYCFGGQTTGKLMTDLAIFDGRQGPEFIERFFRKNPAMAVFYCTFVQGALSQTKRKFARGDGARNAFCRRHCGPAFCSYGRDKLNMFQSARTRPTADVWAKRGTSNCWHSAAMGPRDTRTKAHPPPWRADGSGVCSEDRIRATLQSTGLLLPQEACQASADFPVGGSRPFDGGLGRGWRASGDRDVGHGRRPLVRNAGRRLSRQHQDARGLAHLQAGRHLLNAAESRARCSEGSKDLPILEVL